MLGSTCTAAIAIGREPEALRKCLEATERWPASRRWQCWPRDRYVPCSGVTCRRSEPLYNRSSALRPEQREAGRGSPAVSQRNGTLLIARGVLANSTASAEPIRTRRQKGPAGHDLIQINERSATVDILPASLIRKVETWTTTYIRLSSIRLSSSAVRRRRASRTQSKPSYPVPCNR
jgi:hypothetical protein